MKAYNYTKELSTHFNNSKEFTSTKFCQNLVPYNYTVFVHRSSAMKLKQLRDKFLKGKSHVFYTHAGGILGANNPDIIIANRVVPLFSSSFSVAMISWTICTCHACV